MKVACQDTLIPGNNIKEILFKAGKIGFDGIEISGERFLNSTTKTCNALDNSELPLAIICAGHRGWLLSEKKDKR